MRFVREFGLEVGLVAAAHAASCRVPALGHEAGDDPVEHDAVVETVLGQFGDSLDVIGGEVGAKLDDDIAAGGKVKRQGVGHGEILH